VIFFAARVTVT